MNNKIKLIFLGNPEFAAKSLASLVADGRFDILGVVTAQDKPVGRGKVITPPLVKKFAQENNLEVWQPEKLKELTEKFQQLAPDFLVVVAYGKLVPKSILDIPKYGCVNVHGSILPRYRGSAVIQAPILNGDTETGVTIMLMDEALDTGPILKIEKMELKGSETAEDVHDTLAELGAKTLPQTLVDLAEGKITAQTQNGPSSYVKEISKEDGHINWTKPAIEIERLVRGFSPWPGTFSQLAIGNSELVKNVKILSTEKEVLPINKYQIGEAFLDNGKLAIQCGDGALVITKLQMEGGKPLPAEEFLRGHADFIGKILK
jgi:methionyl-tRNA formyltransferase